VIPKLCSHIACNFNHFFNYCIKGHFHVSGHQGGGGVCKCEYVYCFATSHSTLITVSSLFPPPENVMKIEVNIIIMHWLTFYQEGFLPGCS
jgi:hypothetical protein